MSTTFDIVLSIFLGTTLLLMILTYNNEIVETGHINTLYYATQKNGFDLQEILKLHEVGILVNCNVDEVYNALDKLISDSALRKDLGRKGNEIATRKFVWETQENAILNLYRSLLS